MELVAGRDELCTVSYVAGVRPVAELLKVVEFGLEGAFVATRNALGEKVEAPHSFTYVPRQGQCNCDSQQLVSQQHSTTTHQLDSTAAQLVAGLHSRFIAAAEQSVPRGVQHGPLDVFALVKEFMHDSELFQAPLLVLPGAFAGSVDQFFDNFNSSAGTAASNHKWQQSLLV